MVEQLNRDDVVETASQQARYVVHLPVFEGPLDLLLHLIEKRQMEITTISLVTVTDQYLAYLNQWDAETLPLANMSAFVAIAARLLFIKSQSLLPHSSKEEMTSEVESAVTMAEELQRHLIEYKQAKEVATYLRQREEQGLQTHGRSGLLAGIEAQLDWTPPTLVGLEAQFAHTCLSTPFRVTGERGGRKQYVIVTHGSCACQRTYRRDCEPLARARACVVVRGA